MCGIAGIAAADRHQCVTDMLTRQQHRGPDGRGLWSNAVCTLGHDRLAIIDLKDGGQPMADRSGAAHIVFNGEIYNFRKLRAALGEAKFRTHSDTEAILELGLAGDPQKPWEWTPRLDGMFAFVMVHNDRLVMARDPLGIKPLYLGVKDGALTFASELKAFPEDTVSIREFPPGHAYAETEGLHPYYDLPHTTPAPMPAATTDAALNRLCDDLLDRLEVAVAKRLVADVPVGVFLSGGLDSSLVAALAARHKLPLDSFSVGMSGSADREYALLMADELHTRHHERLYTLDEALAALPDVIWHLESFDAALVRSAIPNHFLAELTARHVKVALAGEGADELFAGYDYLKKIPAERLDEELRDITRALHNTNLQRCDRLSMAHGLEVRVPFLDVDVVDLAFRIAPELKMYGPEQTEKWILRKAAERVLPREVAWRKKEKFAVGSGLGDKLAAIAEREISDAEFHREREETPDARLRSKEELMYYRIFRTRFPRREWLPLVGRSCSV